MKKCAIIIVNWNGKKFLKDCLNSVFKQTYKEFDVYFVDNGSVDDSVKYVKNNFKKVKIIQLDKNYGFAKGNNEGIKEAFKDKNVEYIVCLNNDTIVDKNWLKELVKTAEKDEKTGMVSSKALFKDGKVQNAGLIFSKALQINKEGGISLGYGQKDKGELKKEIEIFAPGGVAPLYKRKMLEEIGLFDEDYFAYSEDLDLGFRGRNVGWKAYLSPNAKLVHLHSQTGGVASKFKAYYAERNTLFTAVKNLPLKDLLLFPFYDFKLKLSYLKNKNSSVEKLNAKIGIIKMIWILVKARLSLIYHLPKLLLKRWRIKINEK